MRFTIALLATMIALGACADYVPPTSNPTSNPSGCDNGIVTCMDQRTTPPPTVIDPSKKYTATVHTSRGDFTITFVDHKVATQTVKHFVYLSHNHSYDDLTFQRSDTG